MEENEWCFIKNKSTSYAECWHLQLIRRVSFNTSVIRHSQYSETSCKCFCTFKLQQRLLLLQSLQLFLFHCCWSVVKLSTGRVTWSWTSTAVMKLWLRRLSRWRRTGAARPDHIKTSAFYCFTAQTEVRKNKKTLNPWWIWAVNLSVNAAASCDNELHPRLRVGNKAQEAGLSFSSILLPQPVLLLLF